MSALAAVDFEERLQVLGIPLPTAPQPFGAYVMSVEAGGLLFLTGMLPTQGHQVQFAGRLGAELDVDAGQKAAAMAALNGLALARAQLGSLNRVKRIARLGVYINTAHDFRDHARVADGASLVLQDVFGMDRNPTRVVLGVSSLPFGAAVELDLIFEVIAAAPPDRHAELR